MYIKMNTMISPKYCTKIGIVVELQVTDKAPVLVTVVDKAYLKALPSLLNCASE